MRKFWKRSDVHEIESLLRRQRPQPPDELVDNLARRVSGTPAAPRPKLARSSFATAVIVVALVVLAGFGALGRAASAVSNSASAAVETVKSAVAPDSKTPAPESPSGYSAKTKAAESEYVEKQAVCHKGKNTLFLPPSAIPAHLAHGDTLGPCPGD
jgi:hypothetical protein